MHYMSFRGVKTPPKQKKRVPSLHREWLAPSLIPQVISFYVGNSMSLIKFFVLTLSEIDETYDTCST